MRCLLFFGCWVLTVSAFHAVIDSHRWTRVVHLGPYWLYVTVTYVTLLLRRPYASACGALCALAARETALFHVTASAGATGVGQRACLRPRGADRA